MNNYFNWYKWFVDNIPTEKCTDDLMVLILKVMTGKENGWLK